MRLSLKSYDPERRILTVTRTWRDWLLRRRSDEVEYLGSCTVWYRLPECRRVGTWGESRLTELWALWRYRQRDAEAFRGKVR